MSKKYMYKNRLKYLREERELKQDDLAQLLGLSFNSFGQFEREDTILPIVKLKEICNFFNVSLDYIFNLTDIKNYDDIKKKIDKKISGQRLKEIRIKYNLTQKSIALDIGITSACISKYELGKSIISTEVLYLLCHKYKISADYLIGSIDYDHLKNIK